MSLLPRTSAGDGTRTGDADVDGHEAAGLAAVLTAARTATADIAVIADSTQAIVHVSASFTAITGYRSADLVGRNCRILQGPGTDAGMTRRMREVLASGEVFEGELLNYRKDGSAFWTELRIIPMRVGNESEVTHYVSVQRDISNKIALLKQLETQALHDHVTGLPNRSAAERAVEEAVQGPPSRGLTTAIGLIDLDDFRVVNNTLGHAAGDSVLQQWASRVLSRLREGDLLARMGGDEFLLILRDISRDTSSRDLQDILGGLHRAVELPFSVDGQQVALGMSMGIALVPDDGTDSRSILRSADDALYATKRRPHPRSTWWQAAAQPSPDVPARQARPTAPAEARSDEPARGRAVGADVFRDALRRGNIVVHLQPVVDLRDGSVHLLEALARLRLPEGRIAYPGEFLPHLDTEDQRVLFVGVLEQALDIIGSWDSAGTHHDLSVNLPPEILESGSLAVIVKDLLDTRGIRPGRLGLELLESQTMTLESQRAGLQGLTALGVGLAMDDLGSGYSSLQRLSSFPFSAIKLDRGLFRHVYARPLETLSIMATLIQMGRDLAIDVVIEGLEERSLTEAAIVLGAPLGQGYFFTEPLAPEDCARWLASFTFGLHRSPVQTALGALAYHWQFARLDAPHPLPLEDCPLTRFLEDAGAGADVESWHALQHSPRRVCETSSRSLIHWFTQRVTASDRTSGGAPSGRALSHG
ncbi:bifunctional diguanylate cyclase/phosphodiesterase [Arthrobacter sp. B0490]|uniref:putative bifunctional diguanylate cyclase/phosphodiesterase n=1 Tax=Arthrobacter sp. B0490 TaxID=2058891 RepID=UPI0015E2B12F|nr:EAL domain-containing protein [Arthrobacter sp. B0490]